MYGETMDVAAFVMRLGIVLFQFKLFYQCQVFLHVQTGDINQRRTFPVKLGSLVL